MNCDQARMMLAAYREAKNEHTDSIEVDMHLERCTACRQILAGYDFIGEGLRSLPPAPLPNDAHAKLMQALATEHARFIHLSPSTAPSAPDFLKPYLRQQAASAQLRDALTAFSSADTGPLPIIYARMRRRGSSSRSHFAIIGLAAACLMIVMLGGLTSLLVLSRVGPEPSSSTGAAILRPTEVKMVNYATMTAYPHVISAIAYGSSIYYTAYGNEGWMLEQTNSKTQVSTPLLATASANPLIVLGSSHDWLVWLELGAPKASSGKHTPTNEEGAPVRSWYLQTLFLGTRAGTSAPQGQGGLRQAITLFSDTLDANTTPAWIHTPIQGIWFLQNTLLVAQIDAKGTSHLVSYQLDTVQSSKPVELASATNGHILISPTANSDGSLIFWSEEWMDVDGLHSNIWEQQTVDAVPHRGAWLPQQVTSQDQLTTDGLSFNPQVVDDTLFLLRSDGSATAVTQPTPGTSPTVTPTGTPGALGVSVTPRVASDVAIYTDESEVQGKLLAYTLHAAPNTPPLMLPTNGPVSTLQGGANFLICQNNDSYEMYTLSNHSWLQVNVDNIKKSGTAFLAVNSDTAIWTSSTLDTPGTGTDTSVQVSFTLFHWLD